MTDHTQGRIVIRDEIIICSRHGDCTEVENVPATDRPVYSRWTCVECGASRVLTLSGQVPPIGLLSGGGADA